MQLATATTRCMRFMAGDYACRGEKVENTLAGGSPSGRARHGLCDGSLRVEISRYLPLYAFSTSVVPSKRCLQRSGN